MELKKKRSPLLFVERMEKEVLLPRQEDHVKRLANEGHKPSILAAKAETRVILGRAE